MDILEVYAELLAEGFDEEEAARLTACRHHDINHEANILGALMVVLGVLLCIALTIGGL